MTGQPAGEILLDASALEPPEPLQRATIILQQMTRGQYLRMLHRRLPYPLFDICRQLSIEYRHFSSEQISGEQSSWIILFWRSDDSATAQRCQQLDR